MKKATDACVLACNNASPAQRGPRRGMHNRSTPRRKRRSYLFPAPPVRPGHSEVVHQIVFAERDDSRAVRVEA